MGTVGTHAINASLYSKMPYDAIRDFSPVAFVAEAEGLLVAHPSVPANTVPELIALARAKPLTYGSAGAGTTGHLAGELFKSMAKVDITHIPYKGNVPAITDILAGQISLVFATLPTVLPHVKAGKLKSIAVLGPNRSTALPDVPTVAESGLPGFEVNNWVGVFAPAGTPPAVVRKAEQRDPAHHAIAGGAGAAGRGGDAVRADVGGTVHALLHGPRSRTGRLWSRLLGRGPNIRLASPANHGRSARLATDILLRNVIVWRGSSGNLLTLTGQRSLSNRPYARPRVTLLPTSGAGE